MHMRRAEGETSQAYPAKHFLPSGKSLPIFGNESRGRLCSPVSRRLAAQDKPNRMGYRDGEDQKTGEKRYRGYDFNHRPSRLADRYVAEQESRPDEHVRDDIVAVERP